MSVIGPFRKMKPVFLAISIGALVTLLGGAGIALGAERVVKAGDVALVVRYGDVVLTRENMLADIEFTLLNLTGDRVVLGVDVVGAPADWRVVIKQQADDYQVARLALEPQAQSSLVLSLEPPVGLISGAQQLRLRATSLTGDLVAQRTINVGVGVEGDPIVNEGVALTVFYSSITGSPSDKFEFDVILNNRTGAQNTFDLDSKAPAGWEVLFVPSYEPEKVISGVNVIKNGQHVLKVQVTPPAEGKPGRYPFSIAAAFEEARAELELAIVLTGKGELSGTTEDGRLNLAATAGEDISRVYRVSNTGTADILGINMLSDTPSGWEVTMEPKLIEQLSPGASRDVAVTIKPSANAIPGDYFVAVHAVNPDTSNSLLLRIDVERSTLWRWFGLGVLVLVISTLMGLYGRLNRRLA